jgi:heme exporter protein D
MARQNYQNHRRFYAPQHFFLYPACLVLTVVCAVGIFRYPENQAVWLALAVLALLLLVAVTVMRQHCALNNQNRIVRLEMRLRYYQLSGERLEPLEAELGFGRLAALRFAPDDELLPLLRRALAENLSADQIKQSIRNWQADGMRA